MTPLFYRVAVVTLVACTAACGDARDAPPGDSPPHDAAIAPDAARPDAPAPDATPDAPPAIDADHDGHPADSDCDDHDPNIWQQLAYNFRDADGDGHTVAASGTVCSGAGLPAGYTLVARKPDCDDTDPAAFTAVTGYVDSDGDGFGVALAMQFCNAGTLPAGFAPVDGDCAPEDRALWVNRPYSFRDVDGDGFAVVEIGVVCSGTTLPPTYLVSAEAGRPLDCNDNNPVLSTALTVFADGDRDGFGAGASQVLCTDGSPPAGFSLSSTDCDDSDSAVFASRIYTAVDLDGDGATAPAMGTRCTAGTLLPPYFDHAIGNDCDDANPSVSIALTVFADADHDGFGAGSPQVACTNGSAPAGFSTAGTDCDDADATAWQELSYVAIDADGDGVTVPASGQLCTNGALPPPFLATAHGNDCDDDDPALTHSEVLYPDHDGDGVGAAPRQIVCIGATVPAGLARGGYDDDDADPAVIETEDSDDLVDLLVLDD